MLLKRFWRVLEQSWNHLRAILNLQTALGDILEASEAILGELDGICRWSNSQPLVGDGHTQFLCLFLAGADARGWMRTRACMAQRGNLDPLKKRKLPNAKVCNHMTKHNYYKILARLRASAAMAYAILM